MADNNNIDFGSDIPISPSSGGVVTGSGSDGPLAGDSPIDGGNLSNLVSPSSGGVVSDKAPDNLLN